MVEKRSIGREEQGESEEISDDLSVISGDFKRRVEDTEEEKRNPLDVIREKYKDVELYEAEQRFKKEFFTFRVVAYHEINTSRIK